MFKSEIIFNGYYGQKNTGDDAFVEVTSWAANKIWQTENIRYLARKDSLPETLCEKKAYPLNIPKTYRIQQQLLIKNTGTLISAGGSTFHSVLQPHHPKYIGLQRKLKGEKLKIGAVGVSLGPFKSVEAEKSNIYYLKNLDFLTLRDKRSFEFASSLDLPYKPIESFDMAAILPSIYGNNKQEATEKTIGVSLCNYERYVNGNERNEKRRNEKVVQVLKEIDARDQVTFKFFIINGHPKNGDRELTLKTIEECDLKNPVDIIEYDKRTQNVWTKIENCDFMLSTRLHGAIFACFANIPFSLIEYHQKCHDFLVDVGYEKELRLYDMEPDVMETAHRILEIVNNPSNYKTPIHTEKMKQKALLNFTSINI